MCLKYYLNQQYLVQFLAFIYKFKTLITCEIIKFYLFFYQSDL